MRKADRFILFIMINLVLLGLMFFHASWRSKARLDRHREEVSMIQRLWITDLCLSTEAWHTRHPSQCDWHSPFQTHPMALEHFPTGALIRPLRN